MSEFDVIAVGDAIVDLLLSIPEKGNHYHVDEQKKELCLMLGEKNPIEDASFSLGGNATHVAIGMSRLGFHTALAAEIGTDEFSGKITGDLQKERVNTDCLVTTQGAQSTFTVGLSVGAERTIFVRHIEREHDFPIEKTQAKWVYLTSMGEKWESMYKKTLEYVQKTGARLAFNPGSTQLHKGAESFKDIIAQCDVLFVNKEEAEEILYGEVLSPEKKESTESLLFRLQRMGAKVTVITDSVNGSYALDSGTTVYTQKIFQEQVTEKTGAGDAFSTGFLGAMMLGKDLQTCLLWGTADAAGVIAKHGGQEGLLTKTELEHMIQKHS